MKAGPSRGEGRCNVMVQLVPMMLSLSSAVPPAGIDLDTSGAGVPFLLNYNLVKADAEY